MTPPACYPENFPAAVQGAGTQEELPDSLNKGGRTKGPGEQSDRIHSTVLVKEEVHIENAPPQTYRGSFSLPMCVREIVGQGEN